MNANPHDNNGSPNREELSAALGRAVQAVREQTIPQDALARSLQRARELRPLHPGRRGRIDRPLLALGALAATLVIGLLFVEGPPPRPMETARTERLIALSNHDMREHWNAPAGADRKKDWVLRDAPQPEPLQQIEDGSANALDQYPPATGLMPKGTSRIHNGTLGDEAPALGSGSGRGAGQGMGAGPGGFGGGGFGMNKGGLGIAGGGISGGFGGGLGGISGGLGGMNGAGMPNLGGDGRPAQQGQNSGQFGNMLPGGPSPTGGMQPGEAPRGLGGPGGAPTAPPAPPPVPGLASAGRTSNAPAGPAPMSSPQRPSPVVRRGDAKSEAPPDAYRLSEEQARQAADLGMKWGDLSEHERAAELGKLTRGLSEKDREAIQNHYARLGAEDDKEGKDSKPAELRTAAAKPAAPMKKEKEVAELEKELDQLQEQNRTLSQRGINTVFNEDADKLKKRLDEVNKELAAARKKAPAAQVYRSQAHSPTLARVYLGDGNTLELVSLQVTVTIEGSRARTLVDHVFRNPHDRQLEGTFEYPLPAGASPSYFAMFLGQSREAVPPRFTKRGDIPALSPEALASLTPVQVAHQVSSDDWGKLQEARIVPRKKALETYEEITRQRIDPALLEYAAGNTFRGRVFPIPAKGYNRVVLAYEELLPTTGAESFYRFALPNCPVGELDFFLQADRAACKDAVFLPKDAARQESGKRLAFHRLWKDQAPEGEVRFSFAPARPDVEAISGQHDGMGPEYLYARIRPQFGKVEQSKPFAGHAVFLLDTSLSEYPARFARNVEILTKVLENDPDLKQFNVLTFNTGSAWVEPKGWLPNTPAGRKTALDRLDGLVLEGATDLSAALDRLVHPGFDVPRGTPLDVFLLSDGNLTWGDTDAAAVVARFEATSPYPTRFNCYRTGLGAENLELFGALTRKGGGVFNCFTDQDVAAASTAHRARCFQVERVTFEGGPAVSDVLIAGRKAAVYPGGDLIVAARFNGVGRTTALVQGWYGGEKVVWEYPLEITGGQELAPRGWAEIAVSSLLALNDPKHEDLVTAYCQEFGIAGPTASFLVLESDNDYKRFKLDEERGKLVQGDLGRFLDEAWKGFGKVVTGREAVQRFLAEVAPRVHLFDGPDGAHVKKLLTLLSDKDCDLPQAALDGILLHRGDVPAAYLQARDADPRNPDPYLTEAQRRLGLRDVPGAVRVLSTVVEMNPGRDDALRYVGYRLLDLHQAAPAVRLFAQVQKQRPFEPHSYRDLARSLEESGKYGLAALQYEAILAGQWHNRFHQSLKEVVQEEYVHMMRQAIQEHALSRELTDLFGERLEHMRTKTESDLRVTISWNTDNTDVDLWVIEPDGTKCFYQHNRTASGGELSQDQTQGYGPERYRIAKAQPGEYGIVVHYFRANPNLLAGETHVNVVIARNAGTPQEVLERKTVILKKQGEVVEVCKVKF